MSSKSLGSSASLDEPFDCSKLVDLNVKELDDLIKEYEMAMERVRGEIVRVYEKAQPYLLQIRDLKKRYKALGMKFEATRAFAMVEKGGSLVSSIDMRSLKEAQRDVLRESKEASRRSSMGDDSPSSLTIDDEPKTPHEVWGVLRLRNLRVLLVIPILESNQRWY